METIEVYNMAITFSRNVLKSLVAKYKVETYLSLESIPVSVAEDLVFKQIEGRMEYDKNQIAKFCKYHTLHLMTCDRKKRKAYFHDNFAAERNRTVYKTGFFKPVESLKKIELVKSLTLQGKKNDEIMRLTGFPRSTVCYLQKEGGVRCVDSRTQFSQEQVEQIRTLSVDFTAREVGEKLRLTERRIRAIAAKNGIHFYHIGGAPKRDKVLKEDEIKRLLYDGVPKLRISKILSVNYKTVAKVATKFGIGNNQGGEHE